MRTQDQRKELCKKGEKIYDQFCDMFPFVVSTPRIKTLELFALLHEKEERKLLLREMMKEYIENISDDDDIFIDEDGEIYRKIISKELF